MGLREWLVTPLLRGHAAEKLSGPLVMYPALGLAAVTAIATGVATLGWMPTLALAAFWASPAGGWVSSRIGDFFYQPEFDPESEKLPRLYEGVADNVRRFIERHKPASMTYNPELVGYTEGSVTLTREGSDLDLHLPAYAKMYKSLETMERTATYTAAHEIGHAVKEKWWHFDVLNTAVLTAGSVVAAGAAMGALCLAGAVVPFALAGAIAAKGWGFLGGCVGYGLLGLTGTHLLANMHSRQGEYMADRYAVNLTRDVEGARRSHDVDEQTRPSLWFNMTSTHPCSYNRVREMRHYFNELRAGETTASPAPAPRKAHLRSVAREHALNI